MTNDPEDFGPLTPVQVQELGQHPLFGESVYDTEETIKWLQNILNNTPPTDPVYNRFKPQLTQTERYLSLKRRHDTYGAGPVIDLGPTVH